METLTAIADEVCGLVAEALYGVSKNVHWICGQEFWAEYINQHITVKTDFVQNLTKGEIIEALTHKPTMGGVGITVTHIVPLRKAFLLDGEMHVVRVLELESRSAGSDK
jgi:hypothetical protein